MAIMVAGGLTFAIPGMEPAYAAQISSNPHLKVSAEGQNADNEIDETNIIQIIVSDGDVNASEDEVLVTVDGDPITMTFFSGAWYAYIAANGIQYTGLIDEDESDNDDLNEISSDDQTAIDALVGGEPTWADADRPTPLVQVLDLGEGEFDIVYEKPANAQTVTLELDDPDSGISLDRDNYPRNTGVVATIDDQALNVDPTSEDTWWFGDNGASGYGAGVTIQTYVDAANARQVSIDDARSVMERAIASVEYDGTEALAELRAKQAAADERVADILTTPAEAFGLIQLYGQGARNSDANTGSGEDPTTIDPNYKGTEQTTYENEYAEDGTKQVAYEEVAGRGDRDVNTPEASPDYKGTALILFQATDGNPQADPETAESDFKGSAQVAYELAIADADLPTEAATGTEPLSIYKGSSNAPVLECVDGDDCVIIDGVTWVKFTETDSNESKFDNTSDDVTNLKTTAGASRGLSFELEYDNGIEGSIGYSTTSIVIDAGDDWGSGEEVGITLTDPDANTNSLSEETLEVTDPDRIIPTIKIGSPLTLAETDLVTMNNRDVKFRITPVSDILVVDIPNNLAAGAQHTLNIEIGEWDDIGAEYFVQDSRDYVGVYMLNYDLRSFGDAADNALLKFDIENHPATSATSDPPFLPPTLVISDTDTITIGATDFGRSNLIDQIQANNPSIDDAAAERFLGKPPAGFSMPISPGVLHNNNGLYDNDGVIRYNIGDTVILRITIDGPLNAGEYPIIVDFFKIGLEDKNDLSSTVNDAIYRLELVEDGDSSSDFVGTLEYVGLNQINVADAATYTGIDAISDEITLISDDSSISVEYHDLDSTGGETVFTAEADTPTHSGSVSLDSDGYKVSDTVMVTVEDADLNTDSSRTDLYTTYDDMISTESAVKELLTVSIDGEAWADVCGLENGLDASSFSLRETGRDSGVFTGTFAVPADHCNDGDAVTVTGTDISVEYVDFRDDSGSVITVSASAGIRSSTGSVSLDRTVYPVPIGGDSETDTDFPTHGDEPLGQKDLTVYVSVTDSDADTSSNGIDSIDAGTVSMEIIRGSEEVDVTITDSTISETAPDSGVFELEMSLAYNSGPTDGCPAGLGNTGCILQGDILHVVYTDSSDASGSENTVTDSATFDLRNGVLQSDQTAYIIGSDAIITLIEPDLNLDSGSTETYDLDLIEWDSDAGTKTLNYEKFSATPSNLLETGPDTGIFQVVVSIPDEIDDDKLERGEEITLEYVDWGPSGSDHVGDKDESITATIYTSNFGATIELDQRVYTWTDKVYITVVAPDHNIDSDQVDEIGNDEDYPIRVSTRGNEIEQYKLVETGADTGIFTGEVILTGFANHDADGDGSNGDATGRTSPEGSGPTNGEIETESESGISVSFKYSDGETVSSSALIRWNVGEVQWLEASYPASGSGIVRIIDPDMNLNPEAVDNFDVTVFSDSDGGGISLTVTETNAATGIFEGTVFFGVGVDTSGHRLRVVEGDTVTAQYYDNTLPAPFKETERVRVGATTLIGTVVPPLERVPISDLRAVDSFGSTLDTISVDSQIQLAADLTNGQDKSQDFAYLIQIQDGNGVTVSLNWITGSLSAGQSLSPATSWTPDEAGTYEVTAFAWESIENPTALSPTATITITVN